MKVPFEYAELPSWFTVPTSTSFQPVGIEVTLNVGPVALAPLTVTEKGPDEAPVGTIATILLLLQFATVALVPFSETVLLPCGKPKLVPEIAT